MKLSRWIALSLALLLLLALAIAAAAFPHTVQSGDTLFSLARRYGTTVDAIAEANNLEDANLIYVDQNLEVPADVKSMSPASAPVRSSSYQTAGGSYAVQAGDTVYSIARSTGTSVTAISLLNNLTNENYIYAGQLLLIPSIEPFEDNVALEPMSGDTATVGVAAGEACTRFNFLKGEDWYAGSRKPGWYVAKEFDGRGALVTWHADKGDTDSGWIDGINISFDAVYVVVTFYPDDGGAPIMMDIVNTVKEPTTGADFGWLANNMCNALEIQYPDILR